MKEKELKLSDVFPDKAEFTLKQTGKTYKLRLFSLRDRQWLQDNFTAEQIKAAFNAKNLQFEDILRMVYHQLEDRSQFLATEKEEVDDDGRKVMVFTPGHVVLMQSVEGAEEFVHIMAALTKALTESEPVIKKYVNAEVKKTLLEMKEAKGRRGQKSSTSSKANTDGVTNIY